MLPTFTFRGPKADSRLHGGLKNLDTKVLDADDTVALMKQITPERNQQEIQEEGGTDFGFAYGDRPVSACRYSASGGPHVGASFDSQPPADV